MAIPRFNFGSGSSGLYNPNQILVPTTLTSADKTQLLDYDKRIADYKTQVDAYNKAVEDHNKSGKGTFSQKEPTDPGITQKEIDTFGTESAARAQQLQTARQNALNILQNPESFSSYYGIGSLGFEDGGAVGEGIASLRLDNRHQEAKVFGLDYVEDAERYNSREELEQLNPSFMVGHYNIRPNISGSYNMSSVDIPENIDGKKVFINRRYKSGGGNLGFNVTTPNRHNFGANVSGNYFTGSTENPEELQAFGFPAKENYGKGLTPQNYYAYYNTPEGLSISGNYQEENPEQERQYGIMLSKQIEFQNVKDLTDRVARLFKGNRVARLFKGK
jgi:hypothetical protein